MTDLISPENVHRLIHAGYNNPSDVDLYIGGNLEVID